MKKIGLVLGLWCMAITASAAEVHLTVRPSQILGLWSFAQTVADLGRRHSDELQSIFDKSKYRADSELKAQLQELHRIHQTFFNESFFFPTYPKTRDEMSWDMSQHFDYQASQSNSLKEFKSRTTQLMPQAEHLRMFQILERLNDVYGELIWNPNSKKLETYGKKLLDTWDHGGLSPLLEKAMAFYRSKWPDPYEVTIHTMPIPSAKAHTRATVIRDAVVLEALLDETDLAGRAGVIFHELCHGAYEAESSEDQKKMEDWFAANASPFTPYAYRLLNEGLATALGNGLAYKTITGKEDESSWYSITEIDQGAKAASELVRSYILNSKPLDQEFANQWISVYAKRFPEALRSIDTRLHESVLLMDGKTITYQDAKSQLRKFYRIGSFFSSAPIDSKESLKTIHEASSDASLVLIAASGSMSQIEKLTKAIPALREALPLLRKKGSSRVIGYLKEKRPIFLFRLKRQEDFTALLKKMAAEKLLPIRATVLAEL